jgi:hypothetical protein
MNDEITIDGVRYKRMRTAVRVSCYGMYDCHLFHRFDGSSPDEIAAQWKAHDDPECGRTSLCPVIVLGDDDKEMRRVGKMVFHEAELQQWLDACNADPDIPRLLAQRTGEAR